MNAGGKQFKASNIGRHAADAYRGKVPKDVPGYHYDPIKTSEELVDALDYELRLVRELVFEEVRRQHFPEVPSRTTCIWLVPKDDGCLKYWWNTLVKDGQKANLYQVFATGKIHQTSQEFLSIETIPLSEWKRVAYSYWAGIRGQNSVEDELLFSGFIEIASEVDSATVGLTNQ